MKMPEFIRHLVGIWTFEDYRSVGIKLINAKGLRRLFLQYRLKMIGYKRGLEIENWANIGENLILAHPHGIVVNQRAHIGNNVTLFQNVTIGSVNTGKRQGVPTIEDNVIIYPGAVVVGNITVGRNAVIAPNAFVNFDVPEASLVIGNPGRVIER